MEVIIRNGTADDIPQVFNLINELATFEKAPNEVTNTTSAMIEDGFGNNPAYFLTVAESENKIVGIAIYYFKYSTWKGKGVFLEDIIVTERFRGNGIGKKLFEAVVTFAYEQNANQVHWQVLDWNAEAIKFYKKYNASFDATWIDCKLNVNQISQLANQSKLL